jgi:hypothetical protein
VLEAGCAGLAHSAQRERRPAAASALRADRARSAPAHRSSKLMSDAALNPLVGDEFTNRGLEQGLAGLQASAAAKTPTFLISKVPYDQARRTAPPEKLVQYPP